MVIVLSNFIVFLKINLTFFTQNHQTKKNNILQLTMASIFSGLPNNLIIKIVQIDSDRKKCEKERMKRNYNEVINQINKITTHDEFCPSIRETIDIGCNGLSSSEIWFMDGFNLNDI